MRTKDWSNGYCPYLNVDVTYNREDGDTIWYDYHVTYNTTRGGAAYTNGYGRSWNVKVNGGTVASGSININGVGYIDVHRGTFSLGKSKDGRNVDIECNLYMDVTWAGVYAGWVGGSGSVWVGARTYNAHGKPSFNVSKSTANYKESITLSWSKSGTQGNANFDRFELWRGSTRLYSGSGTTYSITPSTVTGPKGGNVTYTLKEIHEWYGSYPETSSMLSVKVRSGVVSVYDEKGIVHTGLVTAYGANGESHYVLISAYDGNGSVHSVV